MQSSTNQPKSINITALLVERDQILKRLRETPIKIRSARKPKPKSLQQLIVETPADQLESVLKDHGYKL